jgi:hypothetical protein
MHEREHDNEREIVWPEPRDEPDREPSHAGARLADLSDAERERLTGDGADT